METTLETDSCVKTLGNPFHGSLFTYSIFSFPFHFHTSYEGCSLYKCPCAPMQTQIKTFDNQNTTPLFSCVLTKTKERSLPLCSCVFLRGDYISGCVIGTQSVLLVHWFQVGFFESVVGQILGSGCRIETVVGSLCVSSGCTSYRCLQQVISCLSTRYQDRDNTSWRSGPRTSSRALAQNDRIKIPVKQLNGSTVSTFRACRT